MKIIVCGAGSVGRSIVSYLSRGNNDIIVIDKDSHKLDEISKEWDIQPVQGSASHPDILEKAGASTADMLIAATDCDEVNLTACQVAHTLFNVQKKIARVDSAAFLAPQWNMLYNEENIPVDLVISPEVEIGKYIYQLLKVPCSGMRSTVKSTSKSLSRVERRVSYFHAEKESNARDV